MKIRNIIGIATTFIGFILVAAEQAEPVSIIPFLIEKVLGIGLLILGLYIARAFKQQNTNN